MLALVGAWALAGASPAFAQKKTVSSGTGSKAFPVGYTDIGPTVGLGGLGQASLAIGGRFERGFRAMPEFNNGTLSFEIGADWYHYSNSFVGVNYSFTYIPISATVNYHFPLTDARFDPFVGLGLGYENISTSFAGSGYSSGIYFVGRAGMRYRWKPNLSLYGDLGAGAATLNVGLMWKMGGK
jgi:hypothetical protein